MVNVWTGLMSIDEVWLWSEAPVYYQNWGPINTKPPDDRRRYGVLTTEGGGHWTYVTWRGDISHAIYQTGKGPVCHLYQGVKNLK